MAPNIIGNVTSSPGCLLLSNWCIWASKFRLHGSAWSLGRWNIIWEFSPISRFVLILLFLFFCFLCAYFLPLTFLIWTHKQMIIHLFIPTAFTIWWYWVFFLSNSFQTIYCTTKCTRTVCIAFMWTKCTRTTSLAFMWTGLAVLVHFIVQ